MSDPESGLFGRADRIEGEDGNVRVVDLKTGLNQETPTEDQRRQLLLYAVLVHRTQGEWPGEIAVEDASGNPYVEALDPAEAEGALAEVVAAVSAFNASAGGASLMQSASPDEDTCRWCDYRVACEPYWAQLESGWKHQSVIGDVKRSGTSKGSAYAVVEVTGPHDEAGRELHISGLAQEVPESARAFALTGYNGLVETGEIRARWSSSTRAW